MNLNEQVTNSGRTRTDELCMAAGLFPASLVPAIAPSLSVGFYARASWTPNHFGTFGELHGSALLLACTAGEHSHRW